MTTMGYNDHTKWATLKKAAVQKALNKDKLPSIGTRVLKLSSNKIWFEDGSNVSIEQPMGYVKQAKQEIDMVAAMRGRTFLGAMDINRRGSKDVRFWAIKVGVPFDLYLMHDVPMRDAKLFIDFGSNISRLKNGKQAWHLAQKYTDSHPFKRVR